MLPRDLSALLVVKQPAVSPDGTTVAFVLQRVDDKSNGYRSQVWLAAVDGSSPPLPFTAGEHRDVDPAWSPDGGRLAFISSKDDRGAVETTLYVAPVRTGGATVALARMPDEVGALRWSPDGRQIAFTARTRADRYAADESQRPPLRVSRLLSRLDNVGFTADRPQHAYVVPADGSAAPRVLTAGEYELFDPDWTPDCGVVVVHGAAHERWDLDLKTDIYAVDVATGERRLVTATTGLYNHPSVSPDGTRVAFLGTDDAESSPRNTHVAVIDLAGGQHRWVSSALDRTFAPYPDTQRPHWLDDSTLLVAMEDRGNVHLYRVAADGPRAPEPVWDEQGCVTGYDAAAGVVAFTLSTPTSPGELFVTDGDTARRLTDLTASFGAQAKLRPCEQFTVASADGAVDLDAWLLTPAELDEAGSYPMLVNVHGGPFTQYGNRFFDEVQMQARAGYVVLWCNPRGSSGREEAFGRAICGPPLGGAGWGSVDYADLMSVVDAALEQFPYLDPHRLGILGGSYGGYMTSWVVGHTDRFAAACSERAANNLLTLESTSDAAGAFRTEIGRSHLDAPELYLAMSPITYVRNITTPLLILHSESDLRCPIEQAEQLFVAMRLLEKDVEFVRFPAESHELSRSGSPVHRRQRAEIILEFFDKHLKPNHAETAAP
jgi:dipeptidyl aminopeptidase/acylaminoacyl peptidase